MKNFTILKNGLIRGGQVSYELDPATGLISYSGFVYVGVGFFSKKVDVNPSGKPFQVKTEELLSANVKPGYKVPVGNVFFLVDTVTGSVASVEAHVTGQPIDGVGTLDVSGQYVALLSLDAKAKVYGMSLTIQVRPA